MTPAAADVSAGALSCLTANISDVLSAVVDPFERIARSVRLALRADLPGDTLAFSHHRYHLGDLGDGRVLAYRGDSDPEATIARLRRQTELEGRVLVVTYAGAMPWSRGHDTDPSPHLVSVGRYAADSFHVNDEFSALLPGGRQEPFHGRVGPADVLRAMTAPAPLSVEHSLRLQYALGTACPLPRACRFRWLEPVGNAPAVDDPTTAWISDTETVLRWLSAYFERLHDRPGRERFIDDVWAAAQHHAFRYAYILRHERLTDTATEAVYAASAAWSALPMSLRFAADSARRGRARPAMVTAAFDAVRTAEARCAAEVLSPAGYLTPASPVSV